MGLARGSGPNGSRPRYGHLDAVRTVVPLRCDHLDAVRPVVPQSEVCEQCKAEGLDPVALRLCLSCGWVACSDGSPGRHARAHYEETDHAVNAEIATGPATRWCYVHQRAV